MMADFKDKTDPFENISIIMILGGFILYWLDVGYGVWWTSLGFLIIGIVSLIRELRTKTSNNLIRAIRIILPIMVILLVLRGFFYEGVSFLLILMVLIMYTFIKRMATN